MAGNLITLPLRVSLWYARVLTRVAGGAAERAFSLAGQTIGAASPGRPGGGPRQHAPRPSAGPGKADWREASVEEAVSPAAVEHPSEAPQSPEAPVVQEPIHVSEEPELVRESAEPGAEDGAGAGITVLEPWNGYDHMNARDVIDRARNANVAELAAVRLYESRHRSRQTVLAAVDRQLKLANGGNLA
jgi:hypothetical protein